MNDLKNISIRYKILIPVFFVICFCIAVTSFFNIYKGYENAKSQTLQLAKVCIKPIVLISNNALEEANQSKLDSKEAKELYKSSQAHYIAINTNSINYEYKDGKYGNEIKKISKDFANKKFDYEFFDDYLILKNELNDGYVLSIFDIKKIYDTMIDVVIATSIVAIILTILSSIAIFFISNVIIGYIKTLQNGLDSFFEFLNDDSKKANKIPIVSYDEIGKMTDMINKNIEHIEKNIQKDNSMIKEVTTIAKSVKVGNFDRRITQDANNPSLQQLKLVINEMLENIEYNLDDLMNVLSSYAKHNYTKSANTKGLEGDLFKLANDINIVGNSVVSMLKNNMKNGHTLEKNADELSNSVEYLANKANEQAASLEETAASVEEITTNIKSNANSISQMSIYGNSLQSSVQEGNELAKNTVKAMEEINEQTNAITEAISVIDQISFQTNILSLNAAVEAATAGEAGKGFAVVAAEVRSLASRSAEAAKQIKNIVEEANLKTASGKEIASKMINGYENLYKNINSTIDLISKVTQSSQEQERGIIQINDSMSAIDKITQENANIATQTSNIARDTKELSKIIVSDVNSKEFENK